MRLMMYAIMSEPLSHFRPLHWRQFRGEKAAGAVDTCRPEPHLLDPDRCQILEPVLRLDEAFDLRRHRSRIHVMRHPEKQRLIHGIRSEEHTSELQSLMRSRMPSSA